jgi:prevent-host-death family protein
MMDETVLRGARRIRLAVRAAIGEYGQNGYFGRSILLKTISAKDAKNSFGMLIDTARAGPVTVEKHGRAVVVVLSVEEYERLLAATRAREAKSKRAGT